MDGIIFSLVIHMHVKRSDSSQTGGGIYCSTVVQSVSRNKCYLFLSPPHRPTPAMANYGLHQLFSGTQSQCESFLQELFKK